MTADRFGIVGRVVASAYQVESVVAEGGFGVVYRAHHGGFRAPVALKCLKVPQHLQGEQQTRFLEQFRAEAEVLFRLSASLPTVVRPLHVDAMTTPNGAFVPFIVLEWLEGETLDAMIRGRASAGKRPFDISELLPLMEPVARALERAHHFSGPAGAETIVHCDLKPENVFVAQVAGERTVKILDFGVAQVHRAATRATVGSGALALFTPAYGAPEQWSKDLGATGPWTDVWGMALTMTEALAGRPVIAGDHQGVMRQVLDPKKRPTPRSQGVIVSDAVEAVFARALALHPRERHPDAGSFWKAMLDAQGERFEASSPGVAAPDIPDLVPLARKASGAHKLDLPGVHQIDFDDAAGEGGHLMLDVAPEELLRHGSLAPVSAGPPTAQVPSSLEGATVSVPSLSPNRLATAAAPPNVSAPPALQQPSLTPADGSPRASRPSPAPSSEPPPAPRTLARRIALGAGIAAGSIALTLLDRVYAAVTGEVFSLGPIKTSLIAALLLVAGLALVGRELMKGVEAD